MQDNTLYYTFSAIPQVIGAISAIIATFIHFRITNFREFLIGDGRSVLERWGDPGYSFPEPVEDMKQKKRLQDAIHRRNVPRVKRVIRLLSELEQTSGYSKQDRPTGLQYVYERFSRTEAQMHQLQRWTLYVIGTSFISILASIVCLAMTDAILAWRCVSLPVISVIVNVILFAISLSLAFYLIYLGFSERSLHEAGPESTDKVSPN